MNARSFVQPVRQGKLHPFYGDAAFQQPFPPVAADVAVSETVAMPPQETAMAHVHAWFMAAKDGDLSALKRLVSDHATDFSVNAMDAVSGQTALHIAASKGFLDMAKYLIEQAGALIDLADEGQETAVLKASYQGHLDLARYLLDKQANVNHADRQGQTALHVACSRGHFAVVKQLLFSGANINAMDIKGFTPLASAVCQKDYSIIQLLLEKGADPLAQTNTGEYAYDLAVCVEQLYYCHLLKHAEDSCCRRLRLPSVSHTADVDVIFENQRYSSFPLPSIFLGKSAPGKDKFSAAYLQKSDICGAFCTVDGRPCAMDSVHLPLEKSADGQRLWYWMTDWKVFLDWYPSDEQGWQYAASFEDEIWAAEPTSVHRVRRRRWYRVRRQRNSDEPQLEMRSSPTQRQDDYLERARMCLPGDSESLGSKLSQYENALQILLSNLKLDEDVVRKREAITLTDSCLRQAEELKAQMQGQSNTSGATSSSAVEASSSAAFEASPTNRRQLTVDRLRGLSDPDRWQPDQDAPYCSNSACRKRFSLWLRRHHCRWCGRVFCDTCSSRRVPKLRGMVTYTGDSEDMISSSPPVPLRIPHPSDFASDELVRVCNDCFTELDLALGDAFPMTSETSIQSPVGQSTSTVSTDPSYGRRMDDALANCPVCQLRLEPESGMTQADMEAHLYECLAKGVPGGQVSGDYYVVVHLREDLKNHPECGICFEDFTTGQRMARLNCLCVYHQDCIDDWFSRGHHCPVHYR